MVHRIIFDGISVVCWSGRKSNCRKFSHGVWVESPSNDRDQEPRRRRIEGLLKYSSLFHSDDWVTEEQGDITQKQKDKEWKSDTRGIVHRTAVSVICKTMGLRLL